MAIDLTLTSVLYNPWSGSGGEALTGSNTLEVNYSSLGFVASASDSYKSTAGDIFKVFIDGTRIYRTSDSLYAGGKNFLETNDIDNSVLNGQTSQTWSGSTSDTVWTIDTANQKIILNKTAIAATSLYGSGGGAAVTFSAGTSIIEVRREVQDQSSPAVDFSNASILTEQDLDNSSANVFHMAQQAIETAGNALAYDTGTGTYKAYQPGTTTRKKITQVADPVDDNDAVNRGFISTNIPNITTVAGISADVTTVAGISANVTAVAGDATDIGVVAGKETEIGLLGTSAMATASTGHLALLGTSAMAHASTGDIKIVADAVANVTKVADIDANVTKVADIDSNVTTVAGIGTNGADVTTVAGKATEIGLLGTSAMATATTGHLARLGTADVITDMGLLTASGVIEDMALLGATGVIEDMAQLTATGVVADMALLAGNSASGNTVIEDMNTLATSDIVADLNTLADSDLVADLAAIGATGVIGDIETCADNLVGINAFAARYRVESSAPTGSLDEGDLYYNTTNNNVRYYNGTAWTSVGQTEEQSIATSNDAAVAMSIALG